MGHGIAPLISRSALDHFPPTEFRAPTPQVTRVRTVNVPVACWFPPQACMPAFRQRACIGKTGEFPRGRPPRQKKKSRSTFLLIATCWPAEHGGRGGMAAGHHINVRSARGFREDRKISTLFPKSASANSGPFGACLAPASPLKCPAGSTA